MDVCVTMGQPVHSRGCENSLYETGDLIATFSRAQIMFGVNSIFLAPQFKALTFDC